MRLIFRASDLPLLQHIAFSSKVINADELYNCQVDHDTDCDDMEQAENVGSLDLCRRGVLFKNRL